MNITTITVKKDFKDELTILKIQEGEETLESMIRKLYDAYKKQQEEQKNGE